MKLKPIPENTRVHVQSKGEYFELLFALFLCGYKWPGGDSPLMRPLPFNLMGPVVIIIDSRRHLVFWELPNDAADALSLAEFKAKYALNEDNFTKSEEEIGKESGKIGNNSENSQLNLCELLKGHEGETVFSLIDGEGEVKELTDKGFDVNGWNFRNNGTFTGAGTDTATCLIYPSRALYEQYPLDPYTAWMKWKKELNFYQIRISFQTVDGIEGKRCSGFHSSDLGFRTPSDRDKCIEEIKTLIDKYTKQ